MKDLSKSRISLVGLAAVIAVLVVGGAIYAFMQATEQKSDTASSSQAQTASQSSVSAEELESNIMAIERDLTQNQERTEASKKAVEDEKYRIKVGNE